MNPPSHPAELLFKLGRLQVFHYPSPEDKLAGALPKEVFWQDVVSKHTYGPFKSLHDAMNHYTWMISVQKKQAADASKPDAQVIHVDFVRRKVINYGVPE